MNRKTYQKFMTSAFATIVGLSFCNTVSIAPAKAYDEQPENQIVESSAETLIAKNTVAKEFLETKLYEHQLNDKKVVTLQFKKIPLLTFLSAPGNDAMEKAVEVAKQLEQFSQDSVDATAIVVEWNDKTKDYSIKYQEQELVKINKYVRLPDSNNNRSEDALQATNRLRRLVGNAKPLAKIKGEPKLNLKQKGNANVALVKSSRKGYRGQASWYGPGFHGRKTANGEIFNQNALTAAHRSLPFGTKVKVTNLRNGRSVIVRINDRGPFSGGRIVDLSAAAARVIGMKSSGVAPVRLQILGR